MLQRQKPTGEGQPEKKKTKRQLLQEQVKSPDPVNERFSVDVTKPDLQFNRGSLLPVIENVGPIPILDASKTECKIFVHTLKVGQTIDYLGTAEHRTGVGQIQKFKHPGFNEENEESVWMYIKDAEKSDSFDWVSVGVWGEQKQLGLFDIAKDAVKELPPITNKPAF